MRNLHRIHVVGKCKCATKGVVTPMMQEVPMTLVSQTQTTSTQVTYLPIPKTTPSFPIP